MKKIISLSILVITAGILFGQSSIPLYSVEGKKIAKQRIDSIRDDVVSGKISFTDAAIKYSMDPGSASNGGLYTHIKKGTFVKEFEDVAFKMKEKEISAVFETDYGYHFLVVDAIRGDEIDVRQIMLIPK